MDITSIVGWVVAHGSDLVDVALAVCGVASMITALTPTPKDDALISKARALLDRLSVLTHKDAVGTVKLPLTKSKTA